MPSRDRRALRRLLVATTVALAVGASSMGTAGATLLARGGTSTEASLTQGVERCVDLVVPGATVKVNAKLKVKAAGVKSAMKTSTTVSTGIPGSLRVCVHTDADAQIALNAGLVLNVGGTTTVNVSAEVEARTAVTVKVTLNGVRIL